MKGNKRQPEQIMKKLANATGARKSARSEAENAAPLCRALFGGDRCDHVHGR